MNRTFYVAAILIDGMTKSTSFFGEFAEAQAIITEWKRRGEVPGQSWDKPMLFATIADTNGILETFDYRA